MADLESQLAQERRKVDVDAVNFSVRELVRMYEEGELTIAPSYQRKYRWHPRVASTFLESIFLGLPVPPLFVATNDDFQWEVVDGLQRLSTLVLFLSDEEESRQRIKRGPTFRLEELEKLTQLNGMTYAELTEGVQRYFARQSLQVISLTDKSDRVVRFDLFERLNRGALSLTPQEVRTAVYRGDFIDFLEDLAGNPHLGQLLKLQESNRQDGTAAEQVLKFFAYKNSRDDFKGAVTRFLNDFTAQSQKSFPYESERALFERTFAFLAQVVDGPFLRDKTPVTPLVQLEACVVAIGEILQEGGHPSVPDWDWLNDESLVRFSTGGTNTRAMLNKRIGRAKEIFQGVE